MSQDEQKKKLELNVILIDGDDDTELTVGRVEAAADCRLEVVFATVGNEQALENLVGELNARERLMIKLPPPPGSGPMRIYARTYERQKANFFEGLKEFTASNYGIKLATDAELEEEQHRISGIPLLRVKAPANRANE